MKPNTDEYPNIMTWIDGAKWIVAERKLDQYRIGEPFFADIVMAAVFMPRNIYTTVRYRQHRQGEDLGFAINLDRAGFKSLAATDIEAPHIMYRGMVESHVNDWLQLEQSV